MKYFDSRPRFFQFLFVIGATVLIGAATVLLFIAVSLPTDENVFVNPSSFLYVTQSGVGGVRVGDLLLAAQNQEALTRAQLERILHNDSAKSQLTLTFLRGAEARKLTVTLSHSEFAALQLREIPMHVRVTDVLKDGASDRAGMRIGDLILQINHKTFRNAVHADSILRSGETGKNYSYTILRDNKELDLPVTLASLGINLTTVAFIILSLLFLALALYLVVNRPAEIGARYLALAGLLIGSSYLVPPTNLPAVMRFFIGTSLTLCAMFGFAFLSHAFLYFPVRRTELLSRVWFRPALYVIAFLPLLGWFVPQQPAGLIGATYAGIDLYIILFFFVRKHRSAEYKKRTRPFTFTAIAIGFLGIVFAAVGLFREGPPLPHVVSMWALPLSLFYIIARYRVFDLTPRVRKNIQFSFASTAWTVALAVLFVWLIAKLPYQHLQLPNVHLTASSIEVLSTPLQQQEQTVAEKTVLMVVAIVLALLFWRVGRAGYRFLSEKFYRGEYDYRRSASEMANVMGTNLNMEDLAKGIAQKLSELMRLKTVGALFFKNQQTCHWCEVHGYDGEKWKAFCAASHGQIAEWLNPHTREFMVDSMPAQLKEPLHAHDIHIVVPIRSKEKLIGALLVGEKRSESAFRPEDFEFLASTAKQASVAIENSFLYEALAEQERMKHELEIARRIQLGSLPQTTPHVAGLDVAGLSVPAMEVGGDYFDYLNGEASKLTVIVGDVSGKGTSAALYMSKVQGILRSLHGFGLSPRELFIRANKVLRSDLANKSFVTALGAAFDVERKTLRLARAGHLPLFHFNAVTKSVKRILPKGIGLGVAQEAMFTNQIEEEEVYYNTNDVFLFVTDGITEGREVGKEEFGNERLSSILNSSSELRAEGIRDKIFEAVNTFANGVHPHDDQTVVVVKAV